MTVAKKLRDMHALAADSCDPEFNRALIEAASRIETLEKSLSQIARMKIMPDDVLNRITLHAAIEVAKLHFNNQQQPPAKESK